MTYGIVVNEIKYYPVFYYEEFKKNSLEDNVYYTLRDIFSNIEKIDIILKINDFTYYLTNGHYLEEKNNPFQYSYSLYDEKYLSDLIDFLNIFSEYSFEFIELTKNNDISQEYIAFDIWWKNFEELKKVLNKQYEKIKN